MMSCMFYQKIGFMISEISITPHDEKLSELVTYFRDDLFKKC